MTIPKLLCVPSMNIQLFLWFSGEEFINLHSIPVLTPQEQLDYLSLHPFGHHSWLINYKFCQLFGLVSTLRTVAAAHTTVLCGFIKSVRQIEQHRRLINHAQRQDRTSIPINTSFDKLVVAQSFSTCHWHCRNRSIIDHQQHRIEIFIGIPFANI